MHFFPATFESNLDASDPCASKATFLLCSQLFRISPRPSIIPFVISFAYIISQSNVRSLIFITFSDSLICLLSNNNNHSRSLFLRCFSFSTAGACPTPGHIPFVCFIFTYTSVNLDFYTHSIRPSMILNSCIRWSVSRLLGLLIITQVVYSAYIQREIPDSILPNITSPTQFATSSAPYRFFKNSGVCETTPGVKTFSGYIQIGKNQSMFFWFFEARNNPKTAPFTVWLNVSNSCSQLTRCASSGRH